MPMDFRLAADLTAWREEVRAFLAAEMAPERVAGHADPTDLTGVDEAFERAHHRRAGELGYLGIAVPEADGGGGRPRSWASVYQFEAAYHDAPSIDTAVTLCAPPLMAHGSDEQRATWLPRMVAGEVTGCIAYTEHGAGSDLAAIATVAEPDGDGWRLTGRKALVTGAHKADLCVTVARTTPDVPARHGLSMFLLELPAPGVTVRRRATVNGWTLSEIDLDGAPVPASGLLGRRDHGWAQLTGAITQERSAMAHLGWATRVLDELDRWIDHHPLRVDAADRQAVARLHVDVATGRRLSAAVLWDQDRGGTAVTEAAAAKVWATELLQRIAATAAALVGVDALEVGSLVGSPELAPLRGRLGYEVLERIHPTISVGANEVQRDLIAGAALGLPRHRG